MAADYTKGLLLRASESFAGATSRNGMRGCQAVGERLTSGLETLGIQKPLSTLGMQTPSSFWPPYFHRMLEIFWIRSITCRLERVHQYMLADTGCASPILP